jgi:hypothetical protein
MSKVDNLGREGRGCLLFSHPPFYALFEALDNVLVKFGSNLAGFITMESMVSTFPLLHVFNFQESTKCRRSIGATTAQAERLVEKRRSFLQMSVWNQKRKPTRRKKRGGVPKRWVF